MNKYAVGSSGLGEALKRAASSLASANNTFEESLGLITAMDEILQDPEISGTATKTISMRLRNTAGQLEELDIDAEGAAESITKLQTQLLNLTGGKVNIMLDSDTFKSTYQIITELAQVWNNLSDIQQADITRLVAGNYLVKRPRHIEIYVICTILNPVMPKASMLQCEMKYAA